MGNCKLNRWIDKAQKWFDELLNADIAPTEMLCDVLRDTIGVSACNAFRERAGTPRTGHNYGHNNDHRGRGHDHQRHANERFGGEVSRGIIPEVSCYASRCR